VYPYSSELPALQKIPITSAGTAWIDPASGQPDLLILKECLYFGERLNHTLLCPNQLRPNGLTVHNTPPMIDPSSTHSIYDPVSNITIPMDIKCALSYFDSYAPTLEEAMDMPVIVLTSSINWEQTAADLPNPRSIATLTLVSKRSGDLVSQSVIFSYQNAQPLRQKC
jgi:hypothetical protein